MPIDKITAFFTSQDITAERNKQFPDEQFSSDIYAEKSGKSMLILPFTDYFFIHNFDDQPKHLEHFQKLHESARSYVNAQYKVPKALRISVPNIATIAFSMHAFPQDMTDYVQQNTRSVVGGEFHAMYLIDMENKEFYSPGRNTTYVHGEARLIWGSHKEFKRIDPQNRTFYLVERLTQSLFGENLAT